MDRERLIWLVRLEFTIQVFLKFVYAVWLIDWLNDWVVSVSDSSEREKEGEISKRTENEYSIHTQLHPKFPYL